MSAALATVPRRSRSRSVRTCGAQNKDHGGRGDPRLDPTADVLIVLLPPIGQTAEDTMGAASDAGLNGPLRMLSEPTMIESSPSV